MSALDTQHKFKVVPEVCYHKRTIVPVPSEIPKADRLDEPNDRWPTDPDALAGKCVSVDCELLPGGARHGERTEDDEATGRAEV